MVLVMYSYLPEFCTINCSIADQPIVLIQCNCLALPITKFARTKNPHSLIIKILQAIKINNLILDTMII